MKIKFKIKDTIYTITAKDFNTEDSYIDATDINVLVNDKPRETFGETFAGHIINCLDVLEKAVLAYINNNLEYVFLEVPEEIKRLKEKLYEPMMTVNGREIPKNFYWDIDEPLPVRMITDKGAAYASINGYYILVNELGEVITDIEAFYTNGIFDMYRNDEILYIDESTNEWLREESEDEKLEV